MQTSYSYLDVVGRTTVVLKKKNVVGEHNVPFQVLCSVPQIVLGLSVLVASYLIVIL
jgi:oligosaccharyltransferase complex subunit alpha (ribophorin I)